MNISAYILDYLKQFGTVKVPQFGVFTLESSKAVLNPDNGSILPPSTKIAFHLDYLLESSELAEYIAAHRSVSVAIIENELQVQTDFWKKKLQAEHLLDLPEIGTIYFQEKNMIFKGERLETDFPDFYGLEEIKFSDINDTDLPLETINRENDYKLSKSILWIFLFIVPLAAIIYLGITQKELLFGKKSFDSVSVQTKTRRIEPIKPASIDSAFIKKADSLKRDSIKVDSIKKDSIKKASWKGGVSKKNYKQKSKWHK